MDRRIVAICGRNQIDGIGDKDELGFGAPNPFTIPSSDSEGDELDINTEKVKAPNDSSRNEFNQVLIQDTTEMYQCENALLTTIIGQNVEIISRLKQIVDTLKVDGNK